MEKDKKYNIILGLMIFFFILFVGVCIAWGLSYIYSDKEEIKSNSNSEITNNATNQEQINSNESNVANYPKAIDLDSNEISDIISMLESKIKFMEPSDNYSDELTNNQIIGAAMFFYLNDNPQKGAEEYIYTKDLDSIIEKYFGIKNIKYGELKGTNYSYNEAKQAYVTPMWGSSSQLFINKAEYTDEAIIKIYIDEINLARFENSESITKDTYTQDMVENKLIVTIKLSSDSSFIIANYGYDK